MDPTLKQYTITEHPGHHIAMAIMLTDACKVWSVLKYGPTTKRINKLAVDRIKNDPNDPEGLMPYYILYYKTDLPDELLELAIPEYLESRKS